MLFDWRLVGRDLLPVRDLFDFVQELPIVGYFGAWMATFLA